MTRLASFARSAQWASLAACGLAASLLGTSAALAADSGPRVDPSFPHYQPPYPDTAQVNGEQGNVVLDVEVSASGKVRNIRVDQSSGFADLDNAAIEGVLGWHFLPAVADGDTETAWTKVTIVYKLPTALPVPAKSGTNSL